MATFQKTHPWITFNINLDRLDYEIWIKTGQVRAICEYVSGIPLHPDVQAHLHSVYLAKGVHATTAIEGNTLSEAQVQDRINGKLKLPASQEYLGIEVDNVLLGCNKIKQAVINGETWRLSFDEILQYNTDCFNKFANGRWKPRRNQKTFCGGWAVPGRSAGGL